METLPNLICGKFTVGGKDNLPPDTWRSDQIVELFNSCPPGEYAFEAWDVYCDGAFQYTEYYISVK